MERNDFRCLGLLQIGRPLCADHLPQCDGAMRDNENNVHNVHPIGALNGAERKFNKYEKQ